MTPRRQRLGTGRPVGSRAPRTAALPHRAAATTVSADSLLQLMWLASPALPVGGFSYSEVLEAAVDTERVSSESQASRWLLDQLQLGLARSDLPVVAQAHGAWLRGDAEAIRELNAWTLSTRESHEIRQQTEQMGRSLVEWMKNRPADTTQAEALALLAGLRPAPTWPVAFALAAAQCAATVRESLLAFAFGWAENMVQAALKSVPLGQSAGQRILSTLAAAIPKCVDAALQLGPTERQVCTPMLAILSAQHETQYSRLFRS